MQLKHLLTKNDKVAISFFPFQRVFAISIKSISSEFFSIINYNDLSNAIIDTKLVVYPTTSATPAFTDVSGFSGTKILLPGNNFGYFLKNKKERVLAILPFWYTTYTEDFFALSPNPPDLLIADLIVSPR